MFFWIEHNFWKISWKHGIIDIRIIFSNPLPRMHRLRAHHNLWKRHPYEINEARPLSKQLDCKLNLTNLVFRVVLYHSLGIVYNAGNYSSVDMQWILFHPPKRYSKALKNTPLAMDHCTSSAQNITYLYSYCFWDSYTTFWKFLSEYVSSFFLPFFV